jgi:hypothetical protein
VAAILALLLLCGHLAARGSLYYQTGDFFCLWSGARLAIVGADPYDEAQWAAATGDLYPDRRRGLATSSCAARFAYPLWTALALAPIGALPLEIAASLWIAIGIGGTLAGTALAWRASGGPARLAPLLGLVVVTSQPFWVLLVGGQITGVMLAILGASVWALERGRQWSGGAALAALALKPQIVGLFAPLLLLRTVLSRRHRYVVAAAVAGALLVAASLAADPSWPTSWASEIGGRRLRITTLLPTVWGFSGDVLGAPVLGVVVLATLGVVAALAARRIRTDTGYAAAVLPLSLLAAPHIWSYDYLVLALPWAVAMSLAGRAGRATRLLLLLAIAIAACVLPWLMYAIAFARGGETLSAVVPAASLVVLALAAFAADAGAGAPGAGEGAPVREALAPVGAARREARA